MLVLEIAQNSVETLVIHASIQASTLRFYPAGVAGSKTHNNAEKRVRRGIRVFPDAGVHSVGHKPYCTVVAYDRRMSH